MKPSSYLNVHPLYHLVSNKAGQSLLLVQYQKDEMFLPLEKRKEKKKNSFNNPEILGEFSLDE